MRQTSDDPPKLEDTTIFLWKSSLTPWLALFVCVHAVSDVCWFVCQCHLIYSCVSSCSILSFHPEQLVSQLETGWMKEWRSLSSGLLLQLGGSRPCVVAVFGSVLQEQALGLSNSSATTKCLKISIISVYTHISKLWSKSYILLGWAQFFNS